MRRQRRLVLVSLASISIFWLCSGPRLRSRGHGRSFSFSSQRQHAGRRRVAAGILTLLVQAQGQSASARQNAFWGGASRFQDWDTSRVLEQLLKENGARNTADLPERVQLALQVWYLSLGYSLDLPERIEAMGGRAWWEQVLLNAARSTADGPSAVRYVLNATGDRYVRYIAAEDWTQQEQIYAGKPVVGFGVTFVFAPRAKESATTPLPLGPEVLWILPGSAAEKAGVRRGDQLLEIDRNVVGRTNDPDRYIMGPINSTAEVKLFRPSTRSARYYTLPRMLIQTDPVDAASIGPGAGYIAISSFQPPVRSALAQALEQALPQQPPGKIKDARDVASPRVLVVDLRGNAGGRLSEADTAAEMLTEASRSMDVSIVLLVDEETASASEALAFALRDKVSAKVLGSGSWETAGKGEEQVPFELSDGSAVAMSVDRWAARGFKGIRADRTCDAFSGFLPAASALDDPCVVAALQLLAG